MSRSIPLSEVHVVFLCVILSVTNTFLIQGISFGHLIYFKIYCALYYQTIYATDYLVQTSCAAINCMYLQCKT